MNLEPTENTQLLEIIFSLNVLVPLGIVTIFTYILYRLFKLNFDIDYMDLYISKGNDKLDSIAFDKFVRERKISGNITIAACSIFLIIVYAAVMHKIL